jgi:transcription elongation factor GreA
VAGHDLPTREEETERKQKMNTQFLTNDGQQQARSELEYLRRVKRAEVAHSLREAVEAGDINMNAAFEEARFDQARLEVRIAELEELLATAHVIDLDQVPTDTVSLGSLVHLATSNGRTYRYTIVGSYEADPAAGRISHQSPVGKALLGHKAGDEVLVTTPDGVKVYTILLIE